MNKKKLLAIALVVIMIATLSFGTLAWFTDNETVTNKFMVASSEDVDADKIFSVDVSEKTPGGDGLKEHTYEDILPGDVLEKVVTVSNTGYYDQYIRVTVTVSDAAAWMAALNTNGRVPYLTEIVTDLDVADTWTGMDPVYNQAADEIVYTLYYRNILLGSQDNDRDNSTFNSPSVTVFTAVKIPAAMTQEHAAMFEHEFQITVKADAVQTENVGANAIEAFNTVEQSNG